MKHDWPPMEKIHDGENDHPRAECRRCGDISECVLCDPNALGGCCEGVDLAVSVTVTISHPGKAAEYADGEMIQRRIVLPLGQVVDSLADPVIVALAEAGNEVAASWRSATREHYNDWTAAISREASR